MFGWWYFLLVCCCLCCLDVVNVVIGVDSVFDELDDVYGVECEVGVDEWVDEGLFGVLGIEEVVGFLVYGGI